MASTSTTVITLSILVLINTNTGNAQQMQNTCEYHCPDKKKTPWIKKGYKFVSNGCGSMGIRVNVDDRIKHCCDNHDSCYGICGISRDFCDEDFHKCMKKGCGKDQECISSAGMITMGAKLFGCEPYLKGQRQDCDCLDGYKLDERVMLTLNELYGKLPKDKQKTEDELKEIREKYRGKEDKLINNILKKYPMELITMVDWNEKPLKNDPRKKNDKKYKTEI